MFQLITPVMLKRLEIRRQLFLHRGKLWGYRIGLILFASLSLSSCAMWRSIIPGGVTPAHAEWEGVKAAQVINPEITIDPAVGAAFSVFLGVDVGKVLGVLPVVMIGETAPRYILCNDEYIEKCKAFPKFSKVHFAGESIGPNLWKPSRLTADDFND